MATNDECPIKVDKATYENVVVLLKSLQPSMLRSIKSFQNVLSEQLVGEGDYMLCNNIFMGIVKQFYQIQTDGEVNLILHEISPTDGKETGITLYLTLCEEISSDWLHEPTINCFSADQKFVLIFQKIPFVKKASNEVHFELTSQSTGASILVKHFSPTACLMLPVQKYLSLTDAAAIKSTKCNVWAVVRNFVKEPIFTRRGTGHGIFVIIDPSCYQDSKKVEFCITIFVNSSEFLSNIKPGDILRLQRIGTQPWINNREQMEFLVRSDRDHQVVVFPSDDRDGPFCPDPRFNVTKEDVKMVQQLKVWYEEIKNSRNSTPLRSQHQTARISPVVRPLPFRNSNAACSQSPSVATFDRLNPSPHVKAPSQVKTPKADTENDLSDDVICLEGPTGQPQPTTNCTVAIQKKLTKLKSLVPNLGPELQRKMRRSLDQMLELAREHPVIVKEEFDSGNASDDGVEPALPLKRVKVESNSTY